MKCNLGTCRSCHDDQQTRSITFIDVSLACRLCPHVQAQARDAAMQVQAAVLTAQNVHLRRELGSGWAAADTNIIQVRPASTRSPAVAGPAVLCCAVPCCAFILVLVADGQSALAGSMPCLAVLTWQPYSKAGMAAAAAVSSC
jgi:hypothetical protein